MAKTRKEKAAKAREERDQVAAKLSSKDQAELIKSFRSKMQSGLNKIQKDLDVKAVGLEPPKGTNGAVDTGVLCLNLILGGGYPKHRMTTLIGDSGTGKTTLLGKSEGRMLANGIICHHEDLEGAVDYDWYLKNGTDFNLYLGKRGQPKTLHYIPDFASGNDGFRYISRSLDDAIKFGARDLPFLSGVYYVDSFTACMPESMQENDEKGSSPDHAILLSNELKRIRIKLKRGNASVVGVSQLRINPRCQFGNPEYEPGGNAIVYYPDVRLSLERNSKAKMVSFDKMDKDHPFTPKDTKLFRENGIVIEENPNGTTDAYTYVLAKSIKNRVFPPWKKTYFRIWANENGGMGRGIDPVWDVIRFMEEIGMAETHSKSEVFIKGQAFDYYDLKQEILSKPDLRLECEELLSTGKAFEMYFDRISKRGGTVGTPDPDKDPEEEQEEAEAKGKE
jgi:RecA/RadA recombinase